MKNGKFSLLKYLSCASVILLFKQHKIVILFLNHKAYYLVHPKGQIIVLFLNVLFFNNFVFNTSPLTHTSGTVIAWLCYKILHY